MCPWPGPLTFPQFSNMIQWDTFMLSLLNAQVYFLMNIHYGPKSIVTLSLSSPSLNSGARSLTVTLTLPLHSALQLCTHLIAKYCKRFFYNFAQILLQNIAQEVFLQLCTHLIANIAQEVIFTTLNTSYYKILHKILFTTLHTSCCKILHKIFFTTSHTCYCKILFKKSRPQ